MSGKFQKSSAGVLASVLIGLIIISFMFTGYYGDGGNVTPDVVATVNKRPIKVDEYRRKLQEGLNFYQQLMGGQQLTSQQIEQFGIKHGVLDNIINQKLFTSFAETLGIEPSSTELADLIKTLPYFQRNKQFDVGLYKNLLSQNNLSPSDFEKTIGEDLKMQKLNGLMDGMAFSKQATKDLNALKEKQLIVTAIEISEKDLVPHLEIPAAKIQAFMALPGNEKKIEEHFNKRKMDLSKSEEVKARHILLRVTPETTEQDVEKKIIEVRKTLTAQNFIDVANKITEDPSGKGKGGDLGQFGRGKMIPEFEKVAFSLKPGEISAPVKTQFGFHIIFVESKQKEEIASLAQYKEKMVKEILQMGSKEELKAFSDKLAKELTSMLNKADFQNLKQIQEKFQLPYAQEKSLNRIDKKLGGIQLDAKNVKEIFKDQISSRKTFSFTSPGKIILVSATPSPDKKEMEKSKPDSPQQDESDFQNKLSNQLKKEILSKLRDEAKIHKYEQML